MSVSMTLRKVVKAGVVKWTDFDVCNMFYQRGGGVDPHRLTDHPSMADHGAQNKEARQNRVPEVKILFEFVFVWAFTLIRLQFPRTPLRNLWMLPFALVLLEELLDLKSTHVQWHNFRNHSALEEVVQHIINKESITCPATKPPLHTKKGIYLDKRYTCLSFRGGMRLLVTPWHPLQNRQTTKFGCWQWPLVTLCPDLSSKSNPSTLFVYILYIFFLEFLQLYCYTSTKTNEMG